MSYHRAQRARRSPPRRALGDLVTGHNFFDPAAEFIKAKMAYEAKVGSVTSSRFANLAYPQTSWAQVEAFYTAWLDYTNADKCFGRLPPGLYTGNECKPTMNSAYIRALSDFTYAAPRSKVGPDELVDKIVSGEIYPYNEDFWGYGRTYALELSSSVNMPTELDLLSESVSEAINELPDNVKAALNKIGNLWPKDLIGTLIRWSLIGLGAYGVYYLYQQNQKGAAR